MNILMMTNTYAPHVGGVARSVESFSDALRQAGHRVLVVSPEFEGEYNDGPDVVRVPALQRFNGGDFSVRLPVPGFLTERLHEFQPDLIHAHHPFLMGDTAQRIAAKHDLPIVFTHHTMYEQYTHYVPGDSPALARFVVRLATEFANRCDHVIAPSASIGQTLDERGVARPVTVIPTGVVADRFVHGNGLRARQRFHIPAEAFVIGHVGRLAPEKNLRFLAGAVCEYLADHPTAHFLVVGSGPCRETICDIARTRDVEARLHCSAGDLGGADLADAYQAMNVFAFASQSETQGMVLAEAMTAGVPVVAIDAPGVREVVRDQRNGRLLQNADERQFVAALDWIHQLSAEQRQQLDDAVAETADEFSMQRSCDRLIHVYEDVVKRQRRESSPEEENTWSMILRQIENEWALLTSVTTSLNDALFGDDPGEVSERQ